MAGKLRNVLILYFVFLLQMRVAAGVKTFHPNMSHQNNVHFHVTHPVCKGLKPTDHILVTVQDLLRKRGGVISSYINL